MESQPQNSRFRNNPENFHPCERRETSFNYFLTFSTVRMWSPGYNIHSSFVVSGGDLWWSVNIKTSTVKTMTQHTQFFCGKWRRSVVVCKNINNQDKNYDTTYTVLLW